MWVCYDCMIIYGMVDVRSGRVDGLFFIINIFVCIRHFLCKNDRSVRVCMNVGEYVIYLWIFLVIRLLSGIFYCCSRNNGSLESDTVDAVPYGGCWTRYGWSHTVSTVFTRLLLICKFCVWFFFLFLCKEVCRSADSVHRWLIFVRMVELMEWRDCDFFKEGTKKKPYS